MAVLAPTRPRSAPSQDLRLSLVVIVLTVAGLEVSLTDDDVGLQPPSPVGLLVLLLGTLSLTFRRTAPVPVLVVNAAASLAYLALGQRPPPLPLGVLVALYTLAVLKRPAASTAAAAVYTLVLLAGAFSHLTPLTDDHLYTYTVSAVAAVMVGYGIELSRTRTTLAEQRASELAREQEARTRAAVEQEQARIAREVHDIVAHDVSVMVAQAAAARRVFERRPQAAASALASIEAVGRDALDGLRSLVGLLRTDRGAAEGPPDDGMGQLDGQRSPQPGLAGLPRLLEQVRRAGLPVELTTTGEPRPLPATVELNAFRIVQEALTNSLKHAGPTRAAVTVDYGDDGLDVEVRDWGRGGRAGGPRAGYGLISMQQRVTMLGGQLSAGPWDGAGFRVRARFPLAGGPR